jgi:putative glutamine amidotransferase
MADRLPVIGIPAALGRPTETGYVHQQVGSPYVRALERCGALPLMLPVTENAETIRALVDQVDGILFQGGGDLAPSFYGQEKHKTVTYVDETTDKFELEMCRRGLEVDKPILAICRGIQVLNVALGGTLVQDLPTEELVTVTHRQSAPRSELTHLVHVEPGSRLAELLGSTELAVNSFHHQAIDHPGEGLRVVARSQDDVIEAVEDPSHSFVVGVQFHPEETAESAPETCRLFEGLVAAARSRNGHSSR